MILNNTCPPGVICINTTNAIGIILIFLIIVYVINKDNYKNLYDKINYLQNRQLKSETEIQNKNNVDNNQNYNQDVITNPLMPPLKRNYHIEDRQKGLPINIETRGSGGPYQQLGMLYKDSVNDDTKEIGNNNDTNVLPLYGKPTYRGSNKFLYYTETDKLNPVKIPINYNSKDCTDEYGCEELMDGSDVSIPSYNGNFKVKIYKFNKPRYIPYVD